MAIGSHGTGRGGTVGDVRTGRSAELGKALSFLSLFGAAGVETDHLRGRPTLFSGRADFFVYGGNRLSGHLPGCRHRGAGGRWWRLGSRVKQGLLKMVLTRHSPFGVN